MIGFHNRKQAMLKFLKLIVVVDEAPIKVMQDLLIAYGVYLGRSDRAVAEDVLPLFDHYDTVTIREAMNAAAGKRNEVMS